MEALSNSNSLISVSGMFSLVPSVLWMFIIWALMSVTAIMRASKVIIIIAFNFIRFCFFVFFEAAKIQRKVEITKRFWNFNAAQLVK